MYECINGWTKEKMIAAIQEGVKGKPSFVRTRNTCAYRGDDGNKCAVGCFIPDSEYLEDMDTKEGGVRPLLARHPQLERFMPLRLEALAALQAVHDSKYDYIGGRHEDPRPALIDWIEANVM
jgi:hypothetical protein